MLPWSLPVVDEPEDPVPPVEDESPFDFSSVEEEPVPIDEEEPLEPPLIDDPLSPEEPVPPVLPCAAATPTPSAARAPAKNN
jgi:hypothetical protein